MRLRFRQSRRARTFLGSNSSGMAKALADGLRHGWPVPDAARGLPGRGSSVYRILTPLMDDDANPALRAVVVVGEALDRHLDRACLLSLCRELFICPDPGSALETLAAQQADLLLVLDELPQQQILSLLVAAAKACPSALGVVLSAKPRWELAGQYIRAGAFDYLPAPLSAAKLQGLIAQAAGQCRPVGQDDFFLPICPREVPIAGRSSGLSHALELAKVVSDSQCNPVLITGETGSGKELFAQAIHAWRSRGGQEFVAVNCAALTASLLESELFGHVRGAFTGADREKTGLFELAGTGSIFLDEISEMPHDLQAKLLRVLQEKTFRKVGGTKDIACQASIIASSNRNLYEYSRSGGFRSDLYYRLAVFPIEVPALRAVGRRSDVPLLARYFIRNSTVPTRGRVESISPQAMQLLMEHDWPGNVRELKNVIDRAIILSKGPHVLPEHISILPGGLGSPSPSPLSHSHPLSRQNPDTGSPFGQSLPVPQPVGRAYLPDTAGLPGTAGTSALSPTGSSSFAGSPLSAPSPTAPVSGLSPAGSSLPIAPPPAPKDFSLEMAEREFITRALKETGWQRTKAAALLGITRATLHAKIKRYEIKAPEAAPGISPIPNPA